MRNSNSTTATAITMMRPMAVPKIISMILLSSHMLGMPANRQATQIIPNLGVKNHGKTAQEKQMTYATDSTVRHAADEIKGFFRSFTEEASLRT
jgi:hypothetical protein